MDDPAAAPEQTGQPEASGQSSGQPDWATERERLTSELAELRGVTERQRQQIAGSQKYHQEIQSRGFKSFDEVIPILDRVGQIKKGGFDLDRLSKAFEPDDERKTAPSFDPDRDEQKLREKWSKWREEEAEQERQAAIQKTSAKLDEMVNTKLGEATEREKRLARAFISDSFYESVAKGKSPSESLDGAWSEYTKLHAEGEASADGKKMVELADQVQPKRGATPRAVAGGMGQPNADDNPDEVRSRREAALQRKYAQRRKAAMSGSE